MDRITVPDSWRLARIREDIDAGRLWKARDRLQGHLNDAPADQVILDLLGQVWFAMGDLPQAGRHWWLTERDDEPARLARAAFTERFGDQPVGILRALPRPAPPDRYPASVAARLDALAAAIKAAGVRWEPSPWKWVDGEADGWSAYEPTFVDRYGAVIGVVATIGLAALVVIGLATVLGWIVDLAS
jgi:hypothetical protein